MADNIGHELDWDDVVSNDYTEYTLLPEGEYAFEVLGFTRARHPGSDKIPACNKAIIKIKLHGENVSTEINHNLFLHSKTEGLICSFFTAIGIRKRGEPLKMDWNKVVGCKGRAVVEIRSYVGSDGREAQINQIKRFIEPSQTESKPEKQKTSPKRTYKAGDF